MDRDTSSVPCWNIKRRAWIVVALAGCSTVVGRTSFASAPATLPWPNRLQLDFDVSGQARGLPYRATSRLTWQLDADRYEAQLDMQARFVGTRTQTSKGLWRNGLLMPEQHVDQARTERRYELDWAQRRFEFWREGQRIREGTLETGTQDRLSVFFALALQAWGRLSSGSAHLSDPWAVQVLNQQGAEAWSFAERGPEQLTTPAGTWETRQLERLPGPHNDTRMTLWLSRSHGWLPARIRLADPNGDVVDQHLRSVS